MNKLSVGTKVVPLRKTAVGYAGLDNSSVWSRAKAMEQEFLYVNGYCEDDNDNPVYILGEYEDDGGDYFRLDDVVPYVEKNVAEGQDEEMLADGQDYLGKGVCVEAGAYNLTHGKEYELYTDTHNGEGFCSFRDDDGEIDQCFRYRFKMVEEQIEEEKKEEEEVKMSEVFYINVVGANHHRGWNVFELGMKVYLHDEPNNKFDAEAVRVEDEHGRKIGYVSASVITRVKGCKSAGAIFEKVSKCGEMVGTVKFLNENNGIVIVEVVA